MAGATATKRTRSETVSNAKPIKGKGRESESQEEPPKKKPALKSALKKTTSTTSTNKPATSKSNPSPLTSSKPISDSKKIKPDAKSKTKSTLKAAPATPTTTTEPDSEEEEEEDDDDDVESDSELIKGLSDISDNEIGDSDDQGADSSDDEDEEEEQENKKVGKHSEILTQKLPNSKDDRAVKARLEKLKSIKSKKGLTSTPGVLYLGRLPYGFQESEMKSYFTQFGEVSRLRLSRNKKTGKSKHYAFIEFKDQDVAQIVEETMNNYLIDGHLLQVRKVPNEKVHPKLWIGSNRTFRKTPNDRRERVKHDGPKTQKQREIVEKKLLKRMDDRRKKIKELGIDYDFEGYTK